ncbi:MAG: hypothetical protein Unbinned400contig1000_3 [Prokaryotic dsDNA virus sp.]|nr:MAG: hypothetical protein Unbinned400contig1000_3 [Prokaryotic dsDNA virus sp.]
MAVTTVIQCYNCDDTLNVWGTCIDREGDLIIQVEPCENCIEGAKQDVRDGLV